MNPFLTPTATFMIDDIPYNTIYCFTRNMTINGETFSCPSYPFAIRSDIAFKTDEFSYEPHHDQLTIDYNLNHTIITPNITTPNWSVRDNMDAIRKVFELREQIEEERKKQIFLKITDEKELTFQSATNILSWTICGAAVGWIGLLIWNEVRHRQHRKKAKQNSIKMHNILEELKKLYTNTDEPNPIEEDTQEKSSLTTVENPTLYTNLHKLIC